MKNTRRHKLELKTEAVRVIRPGEIRDVRGGGTIQPGLSERDVCVP